MAKEDFCFTYYDGDAARDMTHMNRLERGAYTDIIISQRKFGWLKLDIIKKLLGRDFEEVWPSIELVMIYQDGFYFIEWLNTSINKSKKHSIHQSENGSKGGRPRKNTQTSKKESQSKANQKPNLNELKPLGDGNGNGDGNESEEKGVQGETESETLDDIKFWTDQVIAKNDNLFEILCTNHQLHVNGDLEKFARDHLLLCSRYNWHERITSQQAFRNSLLKHIIDEKKKLANGSIHTNSKTPSGTRPKKFGSADYEGGLR